MQFNPSLLLQPAASTIQQALTVMFSHTYIAATDIRQSNTRAGVKLHLHRTGLLQQIVSRTEETILDHLLQQPFLYILTGWAASMLQTSRQPLVTETQGNQQARCSSGKLLTDDSSGCTRQLKIVVI
jgi:hypothetical protein